VASSLTVPLPEVSNPRLPVTSLGCKPLIATLEGFACATPEGASSCLRVPLVCAENQPGGQSYPKRFDQTTSASISDFIPHLNSVT